MGKKKATRAKPSRRKHLWARFDAPRRRQAALALTVAATVFLLATGGALAFIRLEEHMARTLLDQNPTPRFEFVDLPESLTPLAAIDLENAIAPFRGREWVEPGLCREVAEALGTVSWVEHLYWVRRRPAGRFEVSAAYRQPLALVQDGSDFVLVDAEGVRLPGSYMYHPSWKLVQGISTSPPPPGGQWRSPDLRQAWPC